MPAAPAAFQLPGPAAPRAAAAGGAAVGAVKPLLLLGLNDPMVRLVANDAVVQMGPAVVPELTSIVQAAHRGVVLDAIVALGRIGAVTVPVNTRPKTDEIAYTLRQSDVSLLFVADQFLGIDFVAMLRAAMLRAVEDAGEAGLDDRRGGALAALPSRWV